MITVTKEKTCFYSKQVVLYPDASLLQWRLDQAKRHMISILLIEKDGKAPYTAFL